MTVTVSALTCDEAFSYFARGHARVDWSSVPTAIPLTGGGRVRFDRRRRQAVIEHPRGGTTVFDLGRHDRTRPASASSSTADLPGSAWRCRATIGTGA